MLCLICAASDALLIAAGVGGLGTIVSQSPVQISVVTLGGALFLAATVNSCVSSSFRTSMTLSRDQRIALLSAAPLFAGVDVPVIDLEDAAWADGPEPAQICRSASGDDYACGEVAANVLRDLIGDAHVSCSIRG